MEDLGVTHERIVIAGRGLINSMATHAFKKLPSKTRDVMNVSHR